MKRKTDKQKINDAIKKRRAKAAKKKVKAKTPLRKREQMKVEQQEARKRKFSDELIYDTIRQMCAAAGPDGAIKPEDVARALYPEQWQTLLKRVRLFAKKLAEQGEIMIVRKGRVVDLDEEEVKGIIKLRTNPDYQPPAEAISQPPADSPTA